MNTAKEYYRTTAARQKTSELRKGGGTLAEREKFENLRRQTNAYLRLVQRRSGAKEVDIEFDTRMAEDVDYLEKLRDHNNIYNQFFRGPEKREWREGLKAGIGDPDAVELFHELYPSYLEYNRLYYAARKRARFCPPSDVEPTKTQGTGNPRWFRSRGPYGSHGKIRIRPSSSGQDKGAPLESTNESILSHLPNPSINLRAVRSQLSETFRSYIGSFTHASRRTPSEGFFPSLIRPSSPNGAGLLRGLLRRI